MFFTVTRSTQLQNYRIMETFYEQDIKCFSCSFLLTYIKHDAVSKFGKVTFCWLALVFDFANKYFKKSYVKPVRDYPLSMLQIFPNT